MAKSLVSVILPVHNAALTLSPAIESILSQTFKRFELIIVDDGSSDRTMKIIRSYRSPKIRVIQQEHQGIATALNHGLQLADGKYIARMDADDRSREDRLEKQVEFLDEWENIGVVSSLVRYQGDTAKNLGYALHVDWLNQLTAPEQIFLRRFQDSPIAHPSVMFRKSLVADHGGYQEGPYPEDYELWLRWMNGGVKMAKIREFMLDWYDSPNRLSRIHSNYSEEAFYNLKARYFTGWFFKTFPDNPPEIVIWGYGPTVKRKSSFLKQYGLTIRRYIDVKANMRNNEVIHYRELQYSKDIFILSYVADRQGKLKILQYLASSGFQEGKDFYMMA